MKEQGFPVDVISLPDAPRALSAGNGLVALINQALIRTRLAFLSTGSPPRKVWGFSAGRAAGRLPAATSTNPTPRPGKFRSQA